MVVVLQSGNYPLKEKLMDKVSLASLGKKNEQKDVKETC